MQNNNLWGKFQFPMKSKSIDDLNSSFAKFNIGPEQYSKDVCDNCSFISSIMRCIKFFGEDFYLHLKPKNDQCRRDICEYCNTNDPYIKMAIQSIQAGDVDSNFVACMVKYLLQMYERNSVWRREGRHLQKIFPSTTYKNWCDKCYEMTLNQSFPRPLEVEGGRLVLHYIYCKECCVGKSTPPEKSYKICKECKLKNESERNDSEEKKDESRLEDVKDVSQQGTSSSSSTRWQPPLPDIPSYLKINSWREHPLFKEAVEDYRKDFGKEPTEDIMKAFESQTIYIALW